MRTDLDYRLLGNRWNGFLQYYQFTTEAEDSTADLVCENYVAKQLGLDQETRLTLAFWFGAVGSPTSMILTEEFGPIIPSTIPKIVEYFKINKQRLSFASDAKYRKIHFESFIYSIQEIIKRYGSLALYIHYMINGQNEPIQVYNNLSNACRRDWYQWGRMGHWCFAEALSHFTDFSISPPTMEFGPGGESHTAGWILAQQKDWIEFGFGNGLDDNGITHMETGAKFFIDWAKNQNWGNKDNINYFTLETACCNYKRQHKGSRYAGCYIDELYDDLQIMYQDWPEKRKLFDLYMKGRLEKLPVNLLYEMNNDYNPLKPAYQKTWHKAFMKHGRMPRVETWFNNCNRQRWCDINELGYESSLEDLWT